MPRHFEFGRQSPVSGWYPLTRGVSALTAFGPFSIEHPIDILPLTDARALSFLEEGRCCTVWQQKRTCLHGNRDWDPDATNLLNDARAIDELSPADLEKLLRAPEGWWLASITSTARRRA